MVISNCCYAPPLTELYDDLGYCSECHKGAVFEEEIKKTTKELCDGDCGNVHCLGGLHQTCYGQKLCKECLLMFINEQERIEFS